MFRTLSEMGTKNPGDLVLELVYIEVKTKFNSTSTQMKARSIEPVAMTNSFKRCSCIKSAVGEMIEIWTDGGDAEGA